jgi:hypothetical protein
MRGGVARAVLLANPFYLFIIIILLLFYIYIYNYIFFFHFFIKKNMYHLMTEYDVPTPSKI